MKLRRAVPAVLLTLALAPPASATETRRWVVDTVDDLLAGRGEGVAVTPQGRLEWSRGWSAGPGFEEPVILAGAESSEGALVVGTSHPARLYRATAERLELLTEVPAEQITALVVRDSGAVVLATAAPGVLFEWSRDGLREVGRLEDGAIWDLAVLDGQVVAAAGSPAALYRLAPRGLERWLELPDLHARCLEVDGDRLLVGTSGKGLVFSVGSEGRLAILVDSPFTEISDLAVGGGAVWAAALVGDPGAAPTPKATGAEDDEGQAQAEISAAADLKLPKVNGATATSEVLRLTPDGGMLRVHRFTEEVVGGIAWDGEGLLVGTGWEGELWRFVDQGGTRLATVDAVQIVGILAGGEALLTQGPAGVLWRTADGERRGRYRSAAKQFEQPVRLGEFRVDPPHDGNRIRFRSGISEQPDGTWLEWSQWLPATLGTVPLPPSRALQWELELAAPGASATAVERVELATAQVNLPPQIAVLLVEEPGVVFLGAPPPSGPVIEAVSPDLSGIFTVIDETQPGTNGAGAKGKKFYRAGYRTVSWVASDPNEDALRFVLELESQAGVRLPVRERVTATQLGIDTSAVPDGTYRFVLTASDEPDNPAAPLTSELASRWFTVDTTPPTVELERRGAVWVATVRDASSPILRVEWSRDGEAWEALAPADGLLDGREERFELPAAEGRHLVVVRAMDRHYNRATAGTMETKQ